MQQLEEWKVSDLIEYARNPRKNDHAVDKVAAAMGDSSLRLHHAVTWKNAVPKIIREAVNG